MRIAKGDNRKDNEFDDQIYEMIVRELLQFELVHPAVSGVSAIMWIGTPHICRTSVLIR